MTDRSAQALGEPAASLQGFPSSSVSGTWFREHEQRPDQPGDGCWFFAGTHADGRPKGRFDLASPQGTCYFAETAEAAVLERYGRLTAMLKPVPRSFLSNRIVSRAPVSASPIANVVDARAPRFGLTRELSTVPDYGLTTRWAAAFHAAGFRGLRYEPRFSTDSTTALALFGPAGLDAETLVHDAVPTEQVLVDMGITVVAIPGRAAQSDDDAEVMD